MRLGVMLVWNPFGAVQEIVDPAAKFCPATVSAVDCAPVAALFGVIDVISGGGSCGTAVIERVADLGS
jgi:hypothetical protein